MKVIDAKAIYFYRLAGLRASVKAEIRGIRKRGRSACVLAKELLGLKNSTTSGKTLEALETALRGLRQARLQARRDEISYHNQRYMEACERGKLDV